MAAHGFRSKWHSSCHQGPDSKRSRKSSTSRRAELRADGRPAATRQRLPEALSASTGSVAAPEDEDEAAKARKLVRRCIRQLAEQSLNGDWVHANTLLNYVKRLKPDLMHVISVAVRSGRWSEFLRSMTKVQFAEFGGSQGWGKVAWVRRCEKGTEKVQIPEAEKRKFQSTGSEVQRKRRRTS